MFVVGPVFGVPTALELDDYIVGVGTTMVRLSARFRYSRIASAILAFISPENLRRYRSRILSSLGAIHANRLSYFR